MASGTRAAARGIAGVSGLRGVYFGYWIVGAAFVAQFVSVGVQNYVVGVFLKPMTDDLGWSRAEFTSARTLGQLATVLVALSIGAHVDRHGCRRLLIIGGIIAAAALFATSFVQELWQWLLLNGIVLTAGAAIIGNLVVNITLSKWFVAKRGRMIGWSSMGVSMAGVALPWVMTQVVDDWGWRAGWRWMAAATLALIFPAAALMRRAPEDYGLHPDGATAEEMKGEAGTRAAADYDNSLTRREALHSPVFYLLVLAFALFAISISVMLFQTIPFLTDNGYSRSSASFMITVTSIPALVTKPIWGALMDRLEARKLVAIGGVMTGIALVLIVVTVSKGWEAGAWASFFLMGCGWGGMIPLQETTWATYFGRRYLGAVRSAGMPFSIGMGAIAVQLVPFYFDHFGNYNGAFVAIAACSFISAVLVMFIRPPKRPARLAAA